MGEKVSVIIPTYNRKNIVLKSLKSVINQTYKNIEIIIVDDGSTDGTKDTIESYIIKNKINNIKYYYQENSGVSEARNNGVIHSTGSIICFLDSDDEWKETKLEYQMFLLENNENISFVVSNENPIKKEIAEISYLKFRDLLYKNVVNTSTVLVRKNVLEDVGLFNTKQRYSEDYNLWLRILYKYNGIIINKSLVIWNKTEDSLSSNLWAMEKGELNNYIELFKEKKINIIDFLGAISYSLLKYIRRIYKKII